VYGGSVYCCVSGNKGGGVCSVIGVLVTLIPTKLCILVENFFVFINHSYARFFIP